MHQDIKVAAEILSNGAVETENVEEEEFVRQGEIFRQQPVAGERPLRKRENSLFLAEADLFKRVSRRDEDGLRQFEPQVGQRPQYLLPERVILRPEFNRHRVVENDLVQRKDELRVAVEEETK